MDIAISTVLVILGVIPGIVFWNSYLSGRFSRQIFGASTVSELAQYIIFAVPLNALGLCAIGHDARMVALNTVLMILSGKMGENIDKVATGMQGTWRFSVAAYLVLIWGSYLAGSLLRRLVWAFRLDARIRFLRMKHDWYYVLQGRHPGVPRQVLPSADILVAHPEEGSRLYRGVISAFEPTSDGEIKELVLVDAKRGKGRGKDFEWREIPGDCFILPGPHIHSINMHYLYFNPPAGKWDRFWYEVMALARSFLLQEP